MQSQWPVITPLRNRGSMPSSKCACKSEIPATGTAALIRSSAAAIHHEVAPPPLLPVTPKREESISGLVCR